MRATVLAIAFAIALAESAVADSVARGTRLPNLRTICGAIPCKSATRRYRLYFLGSRFYVGMEFCPYGQQERLSKPRDAQTFETQATHIRQFCNNHPLATFVQAVIDLYDSLPLKKTPQSN